MSEDMDVNAGRSLRGAELDDVGREIYELVQSVASGQPSKSEALGHQVDADRFVTHHFTLDQFDEAYDVFARAADTGALKVVLTRS